MSEFVTMAELALRIDRLTIDELDLVLDELFMPPRPDKITPEYLLHGLSTQVLRFFFGDQWTEEKVFPVHARVSKASERGRNFLRTDSLDLEDQFRHMQKVANLAEIVFNLQGVEGLRERIALMSNHDLESALGEFECAALLAKPEFKFRFVTPEGTKGLDYEAEVSTATSRTVCCEIKVKAETTVFDTSTLWSTLEKARKQLPKDKPGLIFVRLPEAWIRRSDVPQGIGDAVSKIFRQSHRVVGVVLRWEEWHTTPTGGSFVASRFNYSLNTDSKLYQADIKELLDGMGRGTNNVWLSFYELALHAAEGNSDDKESP